MKRLIIIVATALVALLLAFVAIAATPGIKCPGTCDYRHFIVPIYNDKDELVGYKGYEVYDPPGPHNARYLVMCEGGKDDLKEVEKCLQIICDDIHKTCK